MPQSECSNLSAGHAGRPCMERHGSSHGGCFVAASVEGRWKGVG